MINETDELGFDFEKAKKTIDSYCHSTGVESIIINSKGNKIYEFCVNGSLCQFCTNMNSLKGGRTSCASAHLYGSYQAERFGGKYVYFCPIGMVHWASPITSNGSIQGALIGGPVMMVDPEEFLIEELLEKDGIVTPESNKMKQYIYNIPVIQPMIVNNLAELLYIVASNISTVTEFKLNDNRQFHEIQSQISTSVHFIKSLEDKENQKMNYPFEKEKELLSKIALGDKPASQKILNEILGYVFFSSGKDFEIIKARVLELVVLLSRAAVEGGADAVEIFGLNYKYISDIHQLTSVEDLTFWLSKIMSRFTDCVFNLADVRHKDTIYKAVNYIKRNFTDRITLEEVAGHVYLNPSYFSKVFKSEMNCNFVSYVNKIRVNASKNLLSDITIPLTDVSNLVGFEDQSYFTKVFKKLTGVTPGKFRESRGQST